MAFKVQSARKALVVKKVLRDPHVDVEWKATAGRLDRKVEKETKWTNESKAMQALRGLDAHVLRKACEARKICKAHKGYKAQQAVFLKPF